MKRPARHRTSGRSGSKAIRQAGIPAATCLTSNAELPYSGEDVLLLPSSLRRIVGARAGDHHSGGRATGRPPDAAVPSVDVPQWVLDALADRLRVPGDLDAPLPDDPLRSFEGG